MWKVSYIHMRGYRVSRTFDTKEAAQEFIDVNAMICPLPGVKLIGIFKSGDRVTTIHGDTGEVIGFLTPKSEPGYRTAAIRLDAGYQIGQSETCLIPEAR